ncbi:MAG: tRNA (cytidine(34)-2'-O)-methyltransferase [Candidatus Methylacidiphilales bacterium]
MTTPPFNVVLVEPEIPPNTGNIARLCAATRTVLHLVKPLGFELSDRTLKRAGLDYWRHLTWQTWENASAFFQAVPERRLHLFTTRAGGPYHRADYQPGDYLVFGRETRGLPIELLTTHPERCRRIPMAHPEVRSLNLSSSVALALYEALRQSGALDLCGEP